MNNWFTQSEKSENLTIEKIREACNLISQSPYGGLKIYPNPYLVDKEERVVNRSLKERLFSFPWKPFQKTKIEIYEIPCLTKMIEITNPLTNNICLFCHPLMYDKFKSLINNEIYFE